VETERAAVQAVFPVESRDLQLDPAVDSEDRTAESMAAVAVAPAGCTEERTAVPGTAGEAVVAAERRTAAVLPVVPADKPAGLSSHKEFLPTEHIPAAVGERRLTEEPSEPVPVVGTPAAGTEPVGEAVELYLWDLRLALQLLLDLCQFLSQLASIRTLPSDGIEHHLVSVVVRYAGEIIRAGVSTYSLGTTTSCTSYFGV
jgi:hypothetical protein